MKNTLVKEVKSKKTKDIVKDEVIRFSLAIMKSDLVEQVESSDAPRLDGFDDCILGQDLNTGAWIYDYMRVVTEICEERFKDPQYDGVYSDWEDCWDDSALSAESHFKYYRHDGREDAPIALLVLLPNKTIKNNSIKSNKK